jgi:hypothetical protein
MLEVIIDRLEQQFPEVDFDTLAGAEFLRGKLVNPYDIWTYRYNRYVFPSGPDAEPGLSRREMIARGIARDVEYLLSDKPWSEGLDESPDRLSLFVDDRFISGLNRDVNAYFYAIWFGLFDEDRDGMATLASWQDKLRDWWKANKDNLIWDAETGKYRVRK